jgi:hypothetical protein
VLQKLAEREPPAADRLIEVQAGFGHGQSGTREHGFRVAPPRHRRFGIRANTVVLGDGSNDLQ